MSLYEEAKKEMKPEEIDHWQSDLYLKVTPESKRLVNSYEYRANVTVFHDEIEHRPWFDIPFEYKPFWDEKQSDEKEKI